MFPTGTEHTVPNLEDARTTLKLPAPSEDTGLSLHLSYEIEISSSSGEARSHCPSAYGGLSASVHG